MTPTPMTALRRALTLMVMAASSALLFVGCAKKSGASCSEAVANYMRLVAAEQSRDGDRDRRKTARANRPALQSALLRVCESQEWSLATRQCLAEAKSAADSKTCVPTPPEPTSDESVGPAGEAK